MPVIKRKADYYAAIIAALPIERAAIEAMLDDEHERPKDFIQNRNDTNSYTWGTIQGHNVIVASLPWGVYGQVKATTTVVSIRWSFPNIQWGILVGIGAGVPENCSDLHLGDVAVSLPSAGNAGVLQYDFGKLYHDGTFERIEWLNRPPETLLSALGNLQSKHDRFGVIQAHTHLGKAYEKYTHWAGKSSYPGTEQDWLFKSIYPHETPNDTCEFCNKEETELRGRTNSPQFQIHYGTIASGSLLVKQSEMRQKIAALQRNCICIEMEAAGLMNDFPCLVVRGICDYADSHKNNVWQRYACATAAAFCKELLEYVPISTRNRQNHDDETTPAVQDQADEQIQSTMVQGSSDETITTVQDQAGEQVQSTMVQGSSDETIPTVQDQAEEQEQSTTLQDLAEALPQPSADVALPSNKQEQTVYQEVDTSNSMPAVYKIGTSLDRSKLSSREILLHHKLSSILEDPTTVNNKIGRHGNTLLHAIASVGDVTLAKALFDYGASTEITNIFGCTPLHIAAEEGQVEIVQLLIRLRAKMHATTKRNNTALHIAVFSDNIAVAEDLITAGCPVDILGCDNQTALHIAAFQGSADFSVLLLNRGATVDITDSQGETPLHLASRYGNLAVVELLLKHRSNINGFSADGLTPLHTAAFRGRLEVCKLLVRYGAEIDAVTEGEDTPLHLAVAMNHLDVSEFLMDCGAGPRRKNETFRTPLHVAAEKGGWRIIEALLDHQAEVNVVNVDGDTPLHLAAHFGNFIACRILLNRGAKILKRNKEQRTPLNVAENQDDKTVVELLRLADAKARGSIWHQE